MHHKHNQFLLVCISPPRLLHNSLGVPTSGIGLLLLDIQLDIPWVLLEVNHLSIHCLFVVDEHPLDFVLMVPEHDTLSHVRGWRSLVLLVLIEESVVEEVVPLDSLIWVWGHESSKELLALGGGGWF